jgi:hypothetical protein
VLLLWRQGLCIASLALPKLQSKQRREVAQPRLQVCVPCLLIERRPLCNNKTFSAQCPVQTLLSLGTKTGGWFQVYRAWLGKQPGKTYRYRHRALPCRPSRNRLMLCIFGFSCSSNLFARVCVVSSTSIDRHHLSPAHAQELENCSTFKVIYTLAWPVSCASETERPHWRTLSSSMPALQTGHTLQWR